MISVGTIGSRPCEIVLNKILMEIGGDSKCSATNFVTGTLLKFRLGLKQLGYIPDKAWRHTFRVKFYLETVEKIKAKNLPIAIESHTLCCLKAYYRETIHENIRSDIDIGGESRQSS